MCVYVCEFACMCVCVYVRVFAFLCTCGCVCVCVCVSGVSANLCFLLKNAVYTLCWFCAGVRCVRAAQRRPYHLPCHQRNSSSPKHTDIQLMGLLWLNQLLHRSCRILVTRFGLVGGTCTPCSGTLTRPPTPRKQMFETRRMDRKSAAKILENSASIYSSGFERLGKSPEPSWFSVRH